MTVDPSSITSEDLRNLYFYVDKAIYDNVHNLPDETIAELANEITSMLISQNNVNLTDSQLQKLNNEIDNLQFELSLLKESGVNTRNLGGLSENDIKRIAESSGLSEGKVKGWISSSETKVINAYRDDDKVIISDMVDTDRYLEDLINDASDQIDNLYDDTVYLNNNKMDIQEAEKKLEDINDTLSEIEKTLSSIDGNSSEKNDDLLQRLLATQQELERTRDELSETISANKSASDKALSNTKSELTDTIKTNKRKAEDSLNSTKESLQTTITDNQKKTNAAINSTNDRVGDIESKSLLEYRLDDSDPDNPVLYLSPIELKINSED